MMKSLVICLEEYSARVFLEALLPKIIDTTKWDIIYLVFDGKQDLMKNLPRRLRTWQDPQAKFVIVRDQDSEDCRLLKKRISDICLQNGKSDTLIRIACHELETFYLGDLQAVALGLNRVGLQKSQHKSTYKKPDKLVNAKQVLKKLTQGAYREVSGSRAISAHLNIHENCSDSFNHLVAGMQRHCI